MPVFDIMPIFEKFIILMGADDPEVLTLFIRFVFRCKKSKKISNDQELIQSDPKSCPQNQKGNN